jgi:putative SOS response-associated peptidase YedK
MFREALDRKRCLIPTDGFFEWIAASAAKGKSPPRPFYFHPANHGLAAFAGLWARAHDGRGDALLSFTIITRRAAELVRPIHDRMPIVLAPDASAAWLDPSVDAAYARKLLEVADLPGWTRDPVSTSVN